LHIADYQNLSAGDKMMWYFSLALGIDESMVPYYGRRSSKIFIRGKPICMGYKVLMFCGRDGYPYHLNIHQGKELASERAPHSERVVTRMVDDGHCQLLMCVKHHEMYFDNFFTSYDTLKKLSDLNVRVTGTVRLNHTGSTFEFLTSNKVLMKLRRNSYDCSCDMDVRMMHGKCTS
ncbi:PiggyBac transposable element-derived protein 3, partial [Trichinella spiralis]